MFKENIYAYGLLLTILCVGCTVQYHTIYPTDACTVGENCTTDIVINNVIIKGAYPSQQFTPGEVLTDNVSLVCQVGYSSSVRDVSEKTKEEVYNSYGIYLHRTGDYEIDHLISLELGGSNSKLNLWPEPYHIDLGARQKDVVENWLHKQVCEKGYDLRKAQWQIAHNWTGIYKELKE